MKDGLKMRLIVEAIIGGRSQIRKTGFRNETFVFNDLRKSGNRRLKYFPHCTLTKRQIKALEDHGLIFEDNVGTDNGPYSGYYMSGFCITIPKERAEVLLSYDVQEYVDACPIRRKRRCGPRLWTLKVHIPGREDIVVRKNLTKKQSEAYIILQEQ